MNEEIQELVKQTLARAHEFNLEIELSRNWHWMWSNFYYNKKHFGILKAYRVTIILFFKSILKMIFFLFFNKKKFFINRARFLGLFNSYLGKKSFYRPCVYQVLHPFYRRPWRLPGIHRGP